MRSTQARPACREPERRLESRNDAYYGMAVHQNLLPQTGRERKRLDGRRGWIWRKWRGRDHHVHLVQPTTGQDANEGSIQAEGIVDSTKTRYQSSTKEFKDCSLHAAELINVLSSLRSSCPCAFRQVPCMLWTPRFAKS